MGFSLFPKEVKFFEMFKDQNRKLIKAVTILDELFHSLEDMEDRCTRINIIEAEANTISRSISTELSSTFITPLDREDIHQINITQEALINIVKATATRIGLLECGEVLYPSRRLVRSLKVRTEEVGVVLDKLSRGKHGKRQIERIKAHKYECEMLLLVGLVLMALGFGFNAGWALIALMAAVTVLTLGSVAVYLREWVHHMGANGVRH